MTELTAEALRPSVVFGPVESFALARLAASLASEIEDVMNMAA